MHLWHKKMKKENRKKKEKVVDMAAQGTFGTRMTAFRNPFLKFTS